MFLFGEKTRRKNSNCSWRGIFLKLPCLSFPALVTQAAWFLVWGFFWLFFLFCWCLCLLLSTFQCQILGLHKMLQTWVLYQLLSDILFLDDHLPCKKKTPHLNPWKVLKVLTVKYCLSFPGAYVKWSGKTDTEEIMYFLCAFSNDQCARLSGEFLTKGWFLQAERISISSLLLLFFFFLITQQIRHICSIF